MSTIDVEFTDRYSGSPLEGRPWLRGCWGDCEAMGVFPIFDPEAPRAKSDEPLAIVQPVPSHDDVALVERAYAEGRVVSEDEDGWLWIKCPECNGTGNVDRRTALSRWRRLVKDLVRDLRYAHGSEGWAPEVKHPKLRTRAFYLRHAVREVVRAMTWEQHNTAPCWRQPGKQEWHTACAITHPLRFARSRGPVRWRPR